MFRGILISTGVLLSLAGLVATDAKGQNDAASEKKAEELMWAKDVAADFVSAVLHQNLQAAEMVMAEEYKKTQKDPTQWSQSPLYSLYGIATQGAADWTIERQSIAPDQDEAVFRGPLKYGNNEAELSVRVVKESPRAKWRVSFYDVGPAKARDSSPKK